VAELLAAGASASQLNAAQRTPVDEAQQSGCEDALELLYASVEGGGEATEGEFDGDEADVETAVEAGGEGEEGIDELQA
jgi:hypothetical protein